METKNVYIQPKMEQKCQAHNLKVVGSNPTPATNLFNKINSLHAPQELMFWGFFVVTLSVCANYYANRSSGFLFLNRILFYFLNIYYFYLYPMQQ